MNRAFEDVFGVAGAFEAVAMAGRTDKGILDEGALRSGVEVDDANLRRFRDVYVARLSEALPALAPHGSAAPDPQSNPETRQGILPGVQSILEAIALRADLFPALLTGNCELGARIKLQHFGLWSFFRCGAYGDEIADRRDLFDVAIARAVACGAPPVRPADVVVVGDTVMDIACAKAAGARSVAVATGPSDVATLRDAGADVVVADLSDTAAIMRLFQAAQTGAGSSVQI